MPEQFKKASDMAWLETCTELIRKRELLVLHPYDCPEGERTFGYGHNMELINVQAQPPSTTAHELLFVLEHLTEPEKIAEYLLAGDVSDCYLTLVSELHEWGDYGYDFDTLPIDCKIVLVDMCFNMSWGRLSGFVNMLTAIQMKDWQKASDECIDSRYGRNKHTAYRARKNAALLLHCEEE